MLNTYPVNENVTLLRADGGQVQLATNDYGKGPRRVHLRPALFGGQRPTAGTRAVLRFPQGDKYAAWSSSIRNAKWRTSPSKGLYCVINNTDQPQKTTVTLADGTTEDFDLPDSGIAWREA